MADGHDGVGDFQRRIQVQSLLFCLEDDPRNLMLPGGQSIDAIADLQIADRYYGDQACFLRSADEDVTSLSDHFGVVNSRGCQEKGVVLDDEAETDEGLGVGQAHRNDHGSVVLDHPLFNRETARLGRADNGLLGD